MHSIPPKGNLEADKESIKSFFGCLAIIILGTIVLNIEAKLLVWLFDINLVKAWVIAIVVDAILFLRF